MPRSRAPHEMLVMHPDLFVIGAITRRFADTRRGRFRGHLRSGHDGCFRSHWFRHAERLGRWRRVPVFSETG